VISRRKYYQPEGVLVVGSLNEGLELAESQQEAEAYVIGGGEIFAQALPVADRIYLTIVQTVAECDVFFPEIDMGVWRVSTEISVPKEEKDDHPSLFQILDRRDLDHPA
jgi:dihydrofolate reductase